MDKYEKPKSFEVQWIQFNGYQTDLRLGIVQQQKMEQILQDRGLNFVKLENPRVAIFESQVPHRHIISNQLGCTRFDANHAVLGRTLCELPKGSQCTFEKHVIQGRTDHIIKCE